MNIVEEIVSSCVEVEAARNYWFVRTDGGRLYESFLAQNIISIGYPEIGLGDFYIKDASPESIRRTLLEKVENRYSDHKVPGLVVSQIFRFVFEVKTGDVVVVPSSSSDYLSIGIVTSDIVTHSEIYVRSGTTVLTDPEFTKTKSIRWVRQFPKYDYNPKLLQMFSSHQAIFQVNDYASWIDPMLYDFFKKNGKYHLRLNLEKRDGIKFRELFSTCMSLLDTGDEMLSFLSIEEDSSEIESKISLNSPGDIDLISLAPYILVLISIMVIFVNGGGLKIELKKLDFTLNLGAGSFMDKLNNLLNSGQDRKLKKVLAEQLKNLEITNSKEVVAVLEKINEKNQNPQG